MGVRERFVVITPPEMLRYFTHLEVYFLNTPLSLKDAPQPTAPHLPVLVLGEALSGWIVNFRLEESDFSNS